MKKIDWESKHKEKLRERRSEFQTTSNIKIERFYTSQDISKNIDEKKFVKPLTYSFVNVYPLAISSMPVSYESSSLLKCTVSMQYSRYFIDSGEKGLAGFLNPLAQAIFNNQSFSPGGIPSVVARAAGNAVGNTFGNQRLGRFAAQTVRQLF